MSPPKFDSSTLRTLTNGGSFLVILYGVLYVMPAMANRIVDAQDASIRELVANNRDQRIAADAALRAERDWAEKQIAAERAMCEANVSRILVRLDEFMRQRAEK